MTVTIKNTSLLNKLPSYRNPPVNEVVCGMRFRPTDRLRIPHIGLLWDKFRADYPILQHAPPISSARGEILVDKTTGLPLPRVWFINQTNDQLIQFQKEDELPILIFELKANGIDRENNIRNWFDLAHQWIIQGFTELTTKKMHKIWEIEGNV